jgi:hypothetical protein
MQMRERGREENVLIRPPLECILQIMSFEYIFHKSKTSNAKRKTLVFLCPLEITLAFKTTNRTKSNNHLS